MKTTCPIRALAFLMLVMPALLATACAPSEPAVTLPPMTAEPFTDQESAAKLYDLVALNDHRRDVEAKLGSSGEEMESEGGPHTLWRDGLSGVSVVFWPDGTVRGKTLHFDDVRQLCDITGPADLSVASLINKNEDFETVRYVIGIDSPGIEIAAAQGEDSAGQPIHTRLIAWVNPDGGMLQITIGPDERVIDVRAYVYSGQTDEAQINE